MTEAFFISSESHFITLNLNSAVGARTAMRQLGHVKYLTQEAGT